MYLFTCVCIQAEEVLDKVKQNAYDYPEEVEVCSNPELATPCLTLDLPSVRIPLSAFEVTITSVFNNVA